MRMISKALICAAFVPYAIYFIGVFTVTFTVTAFAILIGRRG